jgi:hypothetical protein
MTLILPVQRIGRNDLGVLRFLVAIFAALKSLVCTAIPFLFEPMEQKSISFAKAVSRGCVPSKTFEPGI